jgi:hypothetical protein
MQLWQNVWRAGLAPRISEAGLKALQRGLLFDDPTLVQGVTTSPPALDCLGDGEMEAGCALTSCGWRGDGLMMVSEASRFFQRLCRDADQALGKAAASRLFLHWFDETPRAEMRQQLLVEVNRALQQRRPAAA